MNERRSVRLGEIENRQVRHASSSSLTLKSIRERIRRSKKQLKWMKRNGTNCAIIIARARV